MTLQSGGPSASYACRFPPRDRAPASAYSSLAVSIMTDATLHLIEGPVGAGKSTYAMSMALEGRAIHIAQMNGLPQFLARIVLSKTLFLGTSSGKIDL